VERDGFVGGVAAMGIPLIGFYNNREEQIVKGIPGKSSSAWASWGRRPDRS